MVENTIVYTVVGFFATLLLVSMVVVVVRAFVIFGPSLILAAPVGILCYLIGRIIVDGEVL